MASERKTAEGHPGSRESSQWCWYRLEQLFKFMAQHNNMTLLVSLLTVVTAVTALFMTQLEDVSSERSAPPYLKESGYKLYRDSTYGKGGGPAAVSSLHLHIFG
ncbi:unnamed protein product [Taenia asiatica]|uniref:Neur_chan_memb domain-containing protein n=1 Tax=Taenia asiatica TaxID=60517 RepID=A0A0R3WCB0_TAEAS|nr:unnamed protein product [Taenia asiatica]